MDHKVLRFRQWFWLALFLGHLDSSLHRASASVLQHHGSGSTAGTGLPTPWSTANNAWENANWKAQVPGFICPSDSPPTNRGESPSLLNYKACLGDDYHQNHFRPDQGRDNRGMFQIERWIGFGAIPDGTSNTVLFGEAIAGGAPMIFVVVSL